MKEILIGTSGWNYKHWKGVFYPDGLSQKKWLSFYAEHFSTVEVNATFYRRLKPETFKRWYEETPEDFVFSIKASRYITHIKRLNDVEEAVASFYKDVEPLKEKLKAILFQLPPGLKFDRENTARFLNLLKSDLKTTIEIRNASFLCEEFYKLLRDKNVALCISDTAGRYPMVIEDTADFFYMRLHGSRVLYQSRYETKELENWIRIIKTMRGGGFVFFDNDFYGNAVLNAKELINMLSKI